MSAEPDPCSGCHAQALERVLAANEILHGVLWAEVDPQRGIAAAEVALGTARSFFDGAGFPP